MVLVLTPLKKERLALEESLIKRGHTPIKKQDQGRWFHQFEELNFILAVGGHGKTEFGIQAQFWIQKFRPKHLITVGAAGALSRHVSPLDVVIARKIIEHDYCEKFDPKAQCPEFECTGLKKTIETPRGFSIHLGAIASGDEDIVDPERAKQLYTQTHALAVAWEGAGGARAARFNKISYQEIRGITDNARSQVAEDFIKNLPRAMDHCAQVLLKELAY